MLLLGVFIVVPAAGPLPNQAANAPSASQPPQAFNAPFFALAKQSEWNEDFERLMQRLYKWWTCAVPQPGETAEEQMQRMEACYREHGMPTPMTEQERKDLEKDIDDLLDHTSSAPATVGQAELADFREVMFEILSKLG